MQRRIVETNSSKIKKIISTFQTQIFIGIVIAVLTALVSYPLAKSSASTSLRQSLPQESIASNVTAPCEDFNFIPDNLLLQPSSGFFPTLSDFDNDGKLDLVRISDFSTTVSFNKGNGDGTFVVTSVVSALAIGSNPDFEYRVFSLKTGDFNKDGNEDFVITASNRKVEVYIGNGTGSFSLATTITSIGFPYVSIPGDYNNDGKLDLAITNFDGLSVLLNNGDNSFSSPITRPLEADFALPTSGDFNDDGKQDILVANYDFNTVSVLLGNGIGGFSFTNIPVPGQRIFDVKVVDINGDNKQDFVTQNLITQDLSIFIGNGNGQFTFKKNIDVKSVFNVLVKTFIVDYTFGDYNNDGFIDLVTVGDNGFDVLKGDGQGNFTSPKNYRFSYEVIFSADLDRDGRLDVFGGETSSSGVVLLNSCSNLVFVQPESLPNLTPDQLTTQTFTATGGTPPYSFFLTAGSSPFRTFDDSGLATYENVRGEYQFDVTALDANGITGSRTYRIEVTEPNAPILPVITGFTPFSGPPGTVVTFAGRNFTGITNVTFNGLSSDFTIKSDSEFTTIVPTGASSGLIQIITANGVVTAFTFQVLQTAPPTLSAFFPTSGSRGDTITVSGNNLGNTTQVKINDRDAGFLIDSNTSIRVIVPPFSTTGKITVTTTIGTVTSTDDFVVIPLTSQINSFFPTSGKVGASVNISGMNFQELVSVKFNGVSTAGVRFLTDNSIDVLVPVGATTGPISVTTTGGTVTTSTNFIVEASTQPPTITNVSPNNGPIGANIFINGTNFDTTTSVKFNGVSADFSILPSGSISTFVPAGATTGKITVTNPAGSADSPTEFVVMAQPEITGVFPNIGLVGGSISISGRNFSGATSVKFNGVSATFTVRSITEISTTVPAGASTGNITVTTPLGTATSAEPFTVILTPVIGSLTPNKGTIGTVVTIGGNNFNNVTDVKFNGSIASFNIISTTSITATVPTGATSGKISITNPAGTATSTDSFTVAPTITGFTPTSGGVGTSVTVLGSGFTGTTSVKFGAVSANFTVNSDSEITTIVPTNAVTSAISVTTAGGTTTSANQFVVVQSATISSFTPVTGVVGTAVTINGTDLNGITSVKFGEANASFTINSASSLTAIVPSGAQTGTITVSGPNGTATSPTSFKVTPNITGFSPNSGPRGGTVIISGTTFTGATSVKFNNATAQFTVNSDSQITAIVPSTATTGLIAVTTPSGIATSAANFTIIAAPTISSFSPLAGAPVGATVTITGTNFSGINQVAFNGASAQFTVISVTSISAIVPAGATTGKISVANGAITAQSTNIFKILPAITGFSPAAAAKGASVIITGTSFTGATSVKFTAAIATFTVNSDTQITAIVPATATSGKISVITPGGTASSAANFTVLAGPTISSFSPASAAVGATVTINGSNLAGLTSVLFNGVAAASIIPVSATQIKAVVPIGATTGKIKVVNSVGSGESTGIFKVLPGITGFSPPAAAKGTTVVINGTSFTGATSVKFTAAIATFTVNSDTQITAIVPATATSGKISVITPGGTASSAANFTVLAGPTISSFSPASAAVGATVTINGSNLAGLTSVLFNGVEVSAITPVTATQIKVVVPAGATTGKIKVVNSVGSGESIGIFKVLPGIISLSPGQGFVGSTVVITGTTFTGTTSVKFGAATATFTVDSDSQITAVVPATATTGKISVTTPGGTAISTASFTVIKAPAITSFSPTSGRVGTVVTINGSNFVGITGVKFNGVDASFTVISAAQIRATAPVGVTTGKIIVTNASGTATSTGTFTALQ